MNMDLKLTLKDKDLYFYGDETGHDCIYFTLYRGNEKIDIMQIAPNKKRVWTESEFYYEHKPLTEEMKSLLLNFFNSEGTEEWRKNKFFLDAMNKILKM